MSARAGGESIPENGEIGRISLASKPGSSILVVSCPGDKASHSRQLVEQHHCVWMRIVQPREVTVGTVDR
jgi:hypothetical protein